MCDLSEAAWDKWAFDSNKEEKVGSDSVRKSAIEFRTKIRDDLH